MTTDDTKKEPRKGNGMTQAWRDSLGEAVRLRRDQRGWSQDELARRLREISGDKEFYSSKASISVIENGQVAPPWDKMLLIARVLGTTIEEMAHLAPPTVPPLSYTQNIQGNSYTGNVVSTGPGAAEVAEKVMALFERYGVIFKCAVCEERERQSPEGRSATLNTWPGRGDNLEHAGLVGLQK